MIRFRIAGGIFPTNCTVHTQEIYVSGRK